MVSVLFVVSYRPEVSNEIQPLCAFEPFFTPQLDTL